MIEPDAPRFVTVTLNPSFDLTVLVDELDVDEVNVAVSEHVQAGGKGINVARCLATLGESVRAVVALGAAGGDRYRRLLGSELATDALRVVPIRGSVRTNVAVVTARGGVTKVNAPGPVLGPPDLPPLAFSVAAECTGAEWVVLCGSTPPGLPPSFLADLTLTCASAGSRVVVDADGALLRAVLGSRPHLCKPNRRELAAAAAGSVDTLGDAVVAARELLLLGSRAVLASLGPQGVLYVDRTTTLHARTPPIDVLSDVGAGDSALAAFLCHADEPRTGIRHAAAAGAAACRKPGSTLPDRSDLDLDPVIVTDRPDPTLVLG